MALMEVTAYTDGSARGNPGPGGYGAVLIYVSPDNERHEKELYGGYSRTTNNRMELRGAISALEALKRPCHVTLNTDSQYVCNAFTKGWVDSWQKRGWKTANKTPVKNQDLWKRLLEAMESHEVSWVWVKGHAGNEGNERADELATMAADGKLGPLETDEGFE